MRNHGVTLIELLVVMAVAMALVIVTGFQFSGWLARYRIETRAKDLHAALSNTRMRAMQQNLTSFFVLTRTPTAATYQIFDDTDRNGVYNAGDTALSEYRSPRTIDQKLTAASFAGTLTVDRRGLYTPPATIQFDLGANDSDYDCIVVAETRIIMGKMNAGVCNEK
jgi:Tfp pilus assembly protein FimT